MTKKENGLDKTITLRYTLKGQVSNSRNRDLKDRPRKHTKDREITQVKRIKGLKRINRQKRTSFDLKEF